MGKKRWTTPEQRTWLEELIPDFVQAQQDKTTGLFFDTIYKEWHDKWPTEPATDKEIKSARGNADKALATKRKAEENVCVHAIF